MFSIKNLSSALDLTGKEYITMNRLCQLLPNFEIFWYKSSTNLAKKSQMLASFTGRIGWWNR